MTRRSKILFAVVFFGFLGTLDSAYLALTALSGVSPVCNFIHGCDLVAASPYSQVFGIPLAVFGVFFYTVIMGLGLWGMTHKNIRAAPFLLFFTVPGFLLSLYFLYLQAFIIRAYCEYCLFSLVTATVLFWLSLWMHRLEKSRPTDDAPIGGMQNI